MRVKPALMISSRILRSTNRRFERDSYVYETHGSVAMRLQSRRIKDRENSEKEVGESSRDTRDIRERF